ncbi:MAG: hypothetical protein JO051_16770 [Acidobacteriaceae bacterium]|nr:hypothetical protein [Acidobacteriaceae bacterium]
MSIWRQLSRGLRVLTKRPSADKDVADEVESYLEEAAEALEAKGMSPEEARRTVRLDLGNATVVREQVRSYGWENVIFARARCALCCPPFAAQSRFHLRMHAYLGCCHRCE